MAQSVQGETEHSLERVVLQPKDSIPSIDEFRGLSKTFDENLGVYINNISEYHDEVYKTDNLENNTKLDSIEETIRNLAKRLAKISSSMVNIREAHEKTLISDHIESENDPSKNEAIIQKLQDYHNPYLDEFQKVYNNYIKSKELLDQSYQDLVDTIRYARNRGRNISGEKVQKMCFLARCINSKLGIDHLKDPQ